MGRGSARHIGQRGGEHMQAIDIIDMDTVGVEESNSVGMRCPAGSSKREKGFGG